MSTPTNIGSSWLTVDGKVINPNAPAGGGGPGRFRISAGTLGSEELLDPVLPSPDAPIIRYSVPPDPEDPEGEPENPPPETVTSVTVLKQQQDDQNDIDVQVEVLPNKVSSKLPEPAKTNIDFSKVKIAFPNFASEDGIVSKFKDKFVFKGKITLQIIFQREGDPKEPSAYGRGTTEEDKEARDVTIGFHESCHLKDYLTWLKANPLPEFTGDVDMSVAAFKESVKAFKSAYDKFFADIEEYTENLTDEVGNPKRSEYVASRED